MPTHGRECRRLPLEVPARLRLALYDAGGAAAADQWTFTHGGLPGPVLMEQAGRALVRRIRACDAHARRLLVLAGAGNNGGDGYVAARHWCRLGGAATVLAYRPPKPDTDAAWAADLAKDAGVEICTAADADTVAAELDARLTACDVVLDAVFGTGITAPLRASARTWLSTVAAALRAADVFVMAVDAPSGIDASNGTLLEAHLSADETVVMGFHKLGLWVWPARGAAGRMTVADLGYPEAVIDAVAPPARLLDGACDAPPARPPDGHKGVFGTVGVVAGSRSMPGAAALVAQGAVRAGAGKVAVYSEAHGHAAVGPEVLRRGGDHSWSELSATAIQTALADVDAVAVGPGLGRDAPVLALVRALLTAVRQPVVVDADALIALAEAPELLRDKPAVVTPHPGEAGVLLGCRAAEVQADRVAAVRALVRHLGCTVVLKGAGTLVADGETLAVSPFAAPGLAVGGSGDVLAGAVAALAARGLAPGEAARRAVWLHGVAGTRLPDAGNLPEELATALATANHDQQHGEGLSTHVWLP